MGSDVSVRVALAQGLKNAGVSRGQSGAVVALQRTSSDLRLNPHLRVVFLDGTFHEEQGEVVYHALPRISTREVGVVLEQAVPRRKRVNWAIAPAERPGCTRRYQSCGV